MLNKDRIQYLLAKYFDKSASPQEEEELFQILNASQHDEEIKAVMDGFWGQQSSSYDMTEESTKETLQSVLRGEKPSKATKPAIIRGRFAWVKAAAAVLLAISIGALFFFMLGDRESARGVSETMPQQPSWQRVQTSRGGQQLVVLPDSSKVWLNALSTLRYPSTFTDTARVVYISGEAYFEVATRYKGTDKDKLPFIVKFSKDAQVEVLGTHFNVRAYDNETTAKTSLLEGAVKVTRGESAALLRPGQQASLEKSGTIHVTDDNEVVRSIAWKSGLFDFKNESIQNVMAELARWYNIQYEYKGHIPAQHYTGSMRRQVSIDQVFTMLESAGSLQFSIINNKVIIRNKQN